MQDERHKTIPFKFINKTYDVPAEMNREVIVNGKKGVITEDMGSYIGVNFYEKITDGPLPCHPTWEVQYLETFNHNPPVKKLTASQKRYREFKEADWFNGSFFDWIKITSNL